MRLSERMREVLTEGKAPQGLRRTHVPGPGKPPWPAHPATLAALLRHELLDHAVMRDRRGYMMEVWSTNDAGREALQPSVPRHRPDHPRFLARPSAHTGDYTTSRHRAIDDLEVLIPAEEWRQRGRVKRADAQDRKARARQARAA